MGIKGPIPNRSDDLSRARDAHRGGKTITKGTARPASIPDPDPDWHPIALMMWEAAQESGQQDFYQSTDWVVLFSLLDDLSHYKRTNMRNGNIMATIYSVLGSLLFTEGDRRRVQVELDAADDSEEEAVVAQIDQYRNRLKAVA